MFEHIGTDLDNQATRRQAEAGFLTAFGMSALAAGVAVVGALAPAPALRTDAPVVLVELVEPDAAELAAPPPPPPPPARGGQPADPESDEHEFDEPMVQPLPETVATEVRDDAAPAGVEGGVEGGVAGGVVGGVLGGVVGGVLGGEPGGSADGGKVRTFHHSELIVRKRVQPVYPAAALPLGLGDQRCLVHVVIDERGVPVDVEVEGCPAVFEGETREALLGWRWVPVKDRGQPIGAATTIAVNYRTP